MKNIQMQLGKQVLFLFLFLVLAVGRSWATTYPDMASVAKPSPEPTLPSGSDPFTPPVTATTPASGAPTITTLTPPIGKPDDSVITIGEKFSTYTGTDAGKDSSVVIYGQNTTSSAEANCLYQRLNGKEATVNLPSTLPPSSMYLVWPSNSVGYGYPVAINRTEAWWMGLSSARIAPGDSVSIYGRNLSHNQGTNLTDSHVYIKPSGGAGQWLTLTSVNPYQVTFTVPSSGVGSTNGTYEIWIHNGHGGHYGWSQVPQPLVIAPHYAITHAIEMPAPSGGDDSAALETVWLTARTYASNNPSAIVGIHFQSGVYSIHEGFIMQSNFIVYGSGKGTTTLQCNSNFPAAPLPGEYPSDKFGVFYENGLALTNCQISDMTIDANGNMNAEGLGYNEGTLLYLTSGTTDLRLLNLKLLTLIDGVYSAEPWASNLVVQNCDIYNQFFIIGCNQGSISYCNFYGNNDLSIFIAVSACSNLSLTHNTFQDYNFPGDPDGTHGGWSQGRAFDSGAIFGSCSNTYIGDNSMNQLSNRYAYYGSGEQIMFEGSLTDFTGSPTAVAGNTLTLASLPALDWTTRTVEIVNGTGLGQYRQISSCTSNTITVSSPWTVSPDTSSQIILARTSSHSAVYHNTQTGKGLLNGFNGGGAWVLYGGCYDWIYDSNTVSNMSSGPLLYAIEQDSSTTSSSLVSTQPSWHNYCANNSITNCDYGFYASAPDDPSSTSYAGVAFLGNVWRNNTLNTINVLGLEITGLDTTSVLPMPMHMNLWEHNSFLNVPKAVNAGIDPGGTSKHFVKATDLLFYKNVFTRGTAPLTGSVGFEFGPAGFELPGLRQNTWTGFATTYYANTGLTPNPEALPGQILEVPQRTITVNQVTNSTTTAELTLWNSGTSALSWTVNTGGTPTWLKLSPDTRAGSTSINGTITDENSSQTINVICNSTGLSAGTYTGTITVTALGGTQTKKVTVTMIVSTSGGLTSPWVAQAINGGTGNVLVSNNRYTVQGGGTSFAGTSDSLYYVEQPSTADCSIIARVGSVQNTDPNSKAGVMIQESTAGGAKQAGIWVSSANGITFECRTATGGTATTVATVTGLQAPYWVQLTRTTNSFKAYYSSTGLTGSWTQLGATTTVSMVSSALIGMGVTSTVPGALCTATIDNVTATP